jgi:hypothetical protein
MSNPASQNSASVGIVFEEPHKMAHDLHVATAEGAGRPMALVVTLRSVVEYRIAPAIGQKRAVAATGQSFQHGRVRH